MLTRIEMYRNAQATCGLAVGDYVKIIGSCVDFFGGWGNKWLPDMEASIGTICKIEAIKEAGIQLDNSFSYPFFVLEQVEKPEEEPQKPADTFKPFDRVLVRDTEDQLWRADFYSHYENNRYITVGNYWRYCIPYEGNEHLLGTTKEPE